MLPFKLPAELCDKRNLLSPWTMPWFILKVSSAVLSSCSLVVRISCFSLAISSNNNCFSSLFSFSCFSSSSLFLLLSSNSELEEEIVNQRDNYTHPWEITLWTENYGYESPVKSQGFSSWGLAVLGKVQSPTDTDSQNYVSKGSAPSH